MKNRIAPLLLIVLVALACSCENKTPSKNKPLSNLDVSSLRAKFEFRGRIAFQSDMDGDNEIYVLTKDRLQKLTDNSWSDEFPKWSPDGKRIAFSANPGGKYQIFVMNEDGTSISQVTRSEYDAIEQTWFPDGKKIAFTEQRKRGLGKSYVMWVIDLETKAVEKLLPEFENSNALPEFSPTAQLLGFTGKRRFGWDIFIHDFEAKTTKSLTEGGGACRPHFSPDGQKIGYVSSEADGKGDIWVMNPDGGVKERLTDLPETYDYFPSWSPDGKYIVFSSGTKHYPYQGQWSLNLVKVATKRIIPLFSSGARDVFPDWR
jgi:Tol biopolymer transport system component